MARFNIINGVAVPFTAEENAQKDADEKAWNDGAADRSMSALREERNRLLSETDWWDMSDTTTMTDAQKKYRQALRDITKTYSSMDDNGFAWPAKL
tara:strand:+ start:971 stop:1258 length:288 start_codon:yes stop_codon:yes gene_type:complete